MPDCCLRNNCLRDTAPGDNALNNEKLPNLDIGVDVWRRVDGQFGEFKQVKLFVARIFRVIYGELTVWRSGYD